MTFHSIMYLDRESVQIRYTRKLTSHPVLDSYILRWRGYIFTTTVIYIIYMLFTHVQCTFVLHARV